ncbi:MAG: hypothetical protein Q9190_001455 [Brigantiaea leucoxantha]
MPTELEELVEFLYHGNTQIRQIAAENLVPYSKTQPSVFKANQLTPVKDLKLLVKDYAPIARHVLEILINLSTESDVLASLAGDSSLLESVLFRITNPKEVNADLFAMLLANLAKSDLLSRLLTLERKPVSSLSESPIALTQLLTLYAKGANKSYNPEASFDYLAYLFADLAKFSSIATYLTGSSPPLINLLTPFTVHSSHPRRLGTASAIRNTFLSLPSPKTSLPPLIPSILPCLLYPLIGPDLPFSDAETELLPLELQYLGSEQKQETDPEIVGTILDILFLILARGGEEGRMAVKHRGTYAVLRELHLNFDNEEVRDKVDRVIQILMKEEAEVPAEAGKDSGGGMVTGEAQVEHEDEEEKMIQIF